jgi:hypothetical protein
MKTCSVACGSAFNDKPKASAQRATGCDGENPHGRLRLGVKRQAEGVGATGHRLPW